ncbi:hypothetical protein TNCV_1670501 [Trichonephila clavipes]|nr:hypothetical protein TNCV_1670501 [Trichonephila clavipes]
MRLQKRKGTVDGYEWRCRNQSKDNRHDVVRSVRKGTWFSESKLAITIILRLTRYWFGKSMNEFVMNDLKVNKNMTKLIRHMWRRSYDHKLVNENFHKFLASIARVYPPTDHDEMQAQLQIIFCFVQDLKGRTSIPVLFGVRFPEDSWAHGPGLACG